VCLQHELDKCKVCKFDKAYGSDNNLVILEVATATMPEEAIMMGYSDLNERPSIYHFTSGYFVKSEARQDKFVLNTAANSHSSNLLVCMHCPCRIKLIIQDHDS
jgi:hypothetical protein